MKYFLFLLICLFFSCSNGGDPDFIIKKEYELKEEDKKELTEFIKKHKEYNQQTAFLIDFSVPSNKERFFVIDVETNQMIKKGLVTHGSCSGKTAKPNEVYANTPDSYCTSLGKYKIGNPYQGNFGLAYKLYGLDESNSKAFERYIVLHGHDCVPENKVNYLICESQGCPTVSPTFLTELASIIDASDSPILLWLKDGESN